MNPEPESHPAPSRIPTFRRLFRLVFNRRTSFVVLFLATLVGLFYAVENWRGRRAWEACKRELEAKGEVLDWFAYVPKPVPDAENMMKVPLIESLFIRSTSSRASGRLDDEFERLNGKIRGALAAKQVGGVHGRENLDLAEVVVLLPDSKTIPASNDVVLAMSDLAAGRSGVKPSSGALPTGRTLAGAWGDTLVERSPAGRPPLRLYLRASELPKAKEIQDLFNHDKLLGIADEVRVYPTATTNVFRLAPAGFAIYVAGDYLEATDPLKPHFDAIRAAARRPYARIDTDYNEPFSLPFANFVAVRTVCQFAAERAQACLLLGRPDQALRELSLIQDVRRFLDSGQPTLVAAMIDVAVVGLYVQVVEQGFAANLWQEPQWAALQKQLGGMNLLPSYVRSIRGGERAAAIHLLETYPRKKLARLCVDEKTALWRSPLGVCLLLCPRGWLEQNAAVIARVEQTGLGGIDTNSQRVDVPRLTEATSHVEVDLTRHSVYGLLARIMVPNFSRAVQTTTRNQTFANEAVVACALERYRKATGAYPNSLDALVPRLLDKLPHDIVNGQPLKYRRSDDGGYRLYSVGWDLNDDGGQTGPNGVFDRSSKDWVWIGSGGK